MRVYRRVKNDAGQWRYEVVEEGRGRKTGELLPPFFTRPTTDDGRQIWHRLDAETYRQAKELAERQSVSGNARRAGIEVAEDDGIETDRVPLKAAAEKFLSDAVTADRRPKTVSQYRRSLDEFVEAVAGSVKFLDQITNEHCKQHVAFLRRHGLAGKTIDTRSTIVAGFLKANSLAARLPKTSKPKVLKEEARAYPEETVKKLLAACDTEDRLVFQFFLATGCREQEVQFAEWKDLDLDARTFTVQAKEDVGFIPKSYESRSIPLPDSLVKSLRARRDKSSSRWLFLSSQGSPEGHFLRRLKRLALRAGLNCGHCVTTRMLGEYGAKKAVEISCAKHDCCEEFFLHRFRKTCATRWSNEGIPVRTIQVYLGHESLAVTETYIDPATPNDAAARARINGAYGD